MGADLGGGHDARISPSSSRVLLRWGAVLAMGIGLQLRCLARTSADLPRLTGIGLGLIVAGFWLLTPASPVEGLAIAGRELSRRGVAHRQAVLTLGLGHWFSARVFVLVAAVNAVVAVAIGNLSTFDVVPFLAVAGAGLAMLVVTARMAHRSASAEGLSVLVGRLEFWRTPQAAAERRAAGAVWHREAMAVVGSPANRATLAGLAAASLLADMACLWASVTAAGVHVRADVIVLAASAGLLASVVPLLPGGLGLVEAVIPAVLHHFGAPLDAALAGALTYWAVGDLPGRRGRSRSHPPVRSEPAFRSPCLLPTVPHRR